MCRWHCFTASAANNLPEDVNADGVIDVLDLVAVANGVDAADDLSLAAEQGLLLVLAEAVELQAIAEAPMGSDRHPHALSLQLTSDNVAAAIADAKHIAADDMRLRKGVAVLEKLLQVLVEMGTIPETTALLPNYPNPFNPETWLPYQLSTPSAVRFLSIALRGDWCGRWTSDISLRVSIKASSVQPIGMVEISTVNLWRVDSISIRLPQAISLPHVKC